MLFVEHDMDMVRDISDWVIVMAQGKIVAEGPPDAVMADQRVIDAYLGSHHDQRPQRGDGGGDPRRRPQAEIEAEHERRSSRVSRRADAAPESRPRPSTAAPTSTAAEGAVLRADDLIAGYLPGRQHPQRRRPLLPGGRAGRHHRPQRRRQVDPAQGAVRPGQDPDRHGDAQGRGHHQRARRRARRPGHRLRAADQQRLPVADHPGEPRDGRLPAARDVQEALRVRRRALPRPAATAAASGPARCPAASGRWWRWAAR